MKHFQIDDIINRRKSFKGEPILVSSENKKDSKGLQEQIREVNYQTIDSLIQTAVKEEALNQQQKLNIIQLIAYKTGVNLNKNVIVPFIDLVYYPQVTEISSTWIKDGTSYFILKGKLQIYEAKNQDTLKPNTEPPINKNQSINVQQIEDEIVDKQQQDMRLFHKINKSYELIEQFTEFRSIGSVFNHQRQLGDSKEKQPKKLRLVAIDAIVVQIQRIDSAQNIYNDGFTIEDKIEILNHFPALQVLGKKLGSFINNFNIRHLSLKQLIYKRGDQPKAVYFIIQGQIGFQLLLQENPTSTLSDSQKHQMMVNTESVGQTSYFGEEEILFKTVRVQTAKCISSKCTVLELQKDKFQKLLDNIQFKELITKGAKMKKIQRQRTLKKANQIFKTSISKTAQEQFKGVSEDQLKMFTLTEKKKDIPNRNDDRKFSVRRKSQNKVKVMHGHVIRQFKDNNQDVHFSMRDVYPDMYEAAEKFSKLNTRASKKKHPPEHSWNFKKVWKILNLEDVLRQEEMEIASPEGRRFFDCHRRLINQLNQTKSLRPKTTSSNYRTKLQYIAYLQQFNQ